MIPFSELMLLTMERTSIAFTAKAPSRSFWVFDLPVTTTLSSITESFMEEVGPACDAAFDLIVVHKGIPEDERKEGE